MRGLRIARGEEYEEGAGEEGGRRLKSWQEDGGFFRGNEKEEEEEKEVKEKEVKKKEVKEKEVKEKEVKEKERKMKKEVNEKEAQDKDAGVEEGGRCDVGEEKQGGHRLKNIR